MKKIGIVMRIVTGNREIKPADVHKAVDVIFEEITSALERGDRVELRDFGVFHPRTREARVGRNPRTGEAINIPTKTRALFKTGKRLNDRMNPSTE